MAAVSECIATAAWQESVLADLERLQIFGDVPTSELTCLVAEAEEFHLDADTKVVDESEPFDTFLILLEGKVRITRSDGQGHTLINKVADAPSFMGEVPLLSGLPSYMSVRTATAVRALRVSEGGFWQVLSHAPKLRAAIIAEMSVRVRGMQAQQSQQDKMAMLGTMTAGLMHELNNPGSAARRAASQLRVNLQRMHQLARSFAERGHTPEQRGCLTALQERALALRADVCLSSLQQSDAEEAMGEWMDEHGVEKAWEFAPVLVSSGISPADLECLSAAFHQDLTEPLEWLEATASSMQMVALVEESVSRVAELAQAVKSYAHEGQGGVQDLDVNTSIHTTMVMLKHKLREKNIHVQKDFGAGIPKLHCICSGLNQVWTNLLDNAIDAVPAGGNIAVRTALAGDEVQIAFHDNGSGISPEHQEHIFDPFFTTKEAGVGSGMGLGIVRRILESYGGRLTLESKPGDTEFTVHLPATRG